MRITLQSASFDLSICKTISEARVIATQPTEEVIGWVHYGLFYVVLLCAC